MKTITAMKTTSKTKKPLKGKMALGIENITAWVNTTISYRIEDDILSLVR